MRAIWKDTVIAEAPRDTLIKIEGNWYFPSSSIKREFYKQSDHHTICPWKGEASYYDVVADGETNESGAWYYHKLKDGAIARVGEDFTDYVAFWNGIQVVE